MTDDELIEAIEAQRRLMVAVSTGGPRIDTVNPEYLARRTEIRQKLDHRALHDPNPYRDLWGWYGKWSSGDLPSYRSRRQYLAELYNPLIDRIRRGPAAQGVEVFGKPTGWARVDRTVGEMRRSLEQASTEEEFQSVGLYCREILISLAQAAYDPAQACVARWCPAE